MFDGLYENIGGKIKNLAKWTFYINAVLVVIAGVITSVGTLFSSLYNEGAGPIIIFLSTPFAVALEILVAWVGTWTLYAFGELVEDTHELRTIAETNLNAPEPTKVAAPAPVEEAKPAPTEAAPAPKVKTPQPPRADVDTTRYWVCPRCAKTNLLTRDTCWSCGEKKA